LAGASGIPGLGDGTDGVGVKLPNFIANFLLDSVLNPILGFFDKLVGLNPSDQSTSADSGLKVAPSTLAAAFQPAKKPEVLGFYAEWWSGDKASFSSFSENAAQIDTIAPYWATLEADGTISDRKLSDHEPVIKFAHRNGVKVTLLLNNRRGSGNQVPPITKVLDNPSVLAKAVANIEAYLKKYGLDGVNIDFEELPASSRDKLTDFMRQLYERLAPAGYAVTIDVFPKENELEDFSAAYDYAALSRYSDRVILMTYDKHGTWGTAGAIAPLGWVKSCLIYALNFIPKEKVYLGIAGYGYNWSENGTESLTYQEVCALASRPGISVEWDDSTLSPHFTYWDDAGKHDVWFENAASMKYKLQLVQEYQIAGIALWRLGDEDPGFWKSIKKIRNNT